MRRRSNPREKFFHIIGYGLDGRQVSHDMQSDMGAAERSARRMISNDLDVVNAYVYDGFLDEYNSKSIYDVKSDIPMPLSDDQILGVGADYFSFWISPYGEVYPVPPFGHINAENEFMRFGIVPRLTETLHSYSPAISTGWIQISENSGGGVTFDLARAPSQRQLDVIFDLAQAHKKYLSRRSNLFCRDAMMWLNELVPTRNPDETIRTICGWCEKVMIDIPSGPRGEISHGICPECEKKFEEDHTEIFGENSDYEIVKKALS